MEPMSTSTKVLAFVSLIIYISHLVFNSLAGIGGGKLFPNSVAEVSQTFTLTITPVPKTFAIWGIIFILQLCWSLYAIATVFLTSPAANILSDEFYVAFVINIILITIWLLTWSRKHAVLSFITLFLGQIAIAASIGLSMYDLNVFLDRNPAYCETDSDVWTQRILVQNGLLFYGTWTMIATLLNFTVVLVYYLELSQLLSSLIALTILGVLAIIWFVLEITVLAPYAPCTFAAYIVLMIGLYGIFCSTEKLLRAFTTFLLCLSAIFLLVRLILIGTYDFCDVYEINGNNTVVNMTTTTI